MSATVWIINNSSPFLEIKEAYWLADYDEAHSVYYTEDEAHESDAHMIMFAPAQEVGDE